MKKSIVVLMAMAAIAGTAMADIVNVEAESASPLGTNFVIAADATASGGSYITATFDRGGNPPEPGVEVRATYLLGAVPAATDWDVYARIRVGPEDFLDDSMFVASVFGTDVASANMATINNTGGAIPGLENGAQLGAFAWIALSDAGFPGTINSGAGGDLSWEITSREDGLDLDVFSFVTAGQEVAVVDGALVAIPEPATLGLISIVGAGLLAFRRFFMV